MGGQIVELGHAQVGDGDEARCCAEAACGALGLLQHGFAKWQVPDRFEVSDAVPRTSTGKFWKLKLRERFPR